MSTVVTPAPPRSPRASSPPSAARAVAAIAPAVVLVIAMVAGVNLLIPALQQSSLRPSVSDTAWIVDAYTLVFACLLVPAGALGDRFGRKRGMLGGLALFAAGSAVAALAPSVAVLMMARAISGVGAAFVLPATLAVCLAQLPGPERPKAVALWSAITGVGGVVGNLGGGLAVELGAWPDLFWAGVPLALGSAALVARRVPDFSPHREPIDAIGGGLLTLGTVGALSAVIQGPQDGWDSWQVLGAIVLGLLVLAGFVVYELRASHPMLDPRLFALRGVRAGALGIVALFFALFGLFYVNAQYLQDVKGYGALTSALCILPVALVMPVASARSPQLAARYGGRRVVAGGMLLLAAALGCMSAASAATPYALYGALLALVGVAMGLAMPALSGLMVHALPSEKAGLGSGLNSTTRELGSAVGVAVLSTLLSTRYADRLPAAVHDAPGGEARHSVAAALRLADRLSDPAARARLTSQIRDAFVSGTSLGLRVGAVLVLLVAAVVNHQYPKD